MPLFPQIGPVYLDERHRGILSKMESFYAEAITMNLAFWSEADADLRFYIGDQTIYNDFYGNLPATRRKMYSFNRIRPIVDTVAGYQSRNRKSTIVVPLENGDAQTADQFTKVMMHINRNEHVLETVTDAFRGALITGMNLLHVWMDYRTDPVNGDIRVDNCTHNYFLMDPYWKKSDLSDCNAIWKRTFLKKQECIALMPQHAEEILSLPSNDTGNAKDAKFQFATEVYNYGYQNLLTYDEFWFRDYRTQKLLVDSQTGDTMEWRIDDNEKLRMFLQQYPQITVVESEIPTVNLAIVIQGKVFYLGPNPMGIDQYPFVPVFAYYHPESPYYPLRSQGMVRGLRDSQYLYNRRKIIELDILESQINSGWIYKENALVNPKDVFLNGQGRGLALKEDAQMSDVQQIVPPSVPASMIELSKILAEEINHISGVNQELLGSAIDDKAGILSMLRQGAGLTTLQGLFDQLDLSQKLLGNIIVNLIQTNFTPGKVMKILEGQTPAPQFYNKAFGKYNAAVEEGINTTTQKQMNFAQLLQLREMGMPIPDQAIIEASTLQNKKELMDILGQQQKEAQQVQQQQVQAAMEEQQARTELAHARAMADKGLGVERYSRVQENQALAIERQAKAEHEKDAGLLNIIKALKEIDTVDLQHVEKLLRMRDILEESKAPAMPLSPLAQVPQPPLGGQ